VTLIDIVPYTRHNDLYMRLIRFLAAFFVVTAIVILLILVRRPLDAFEASVISSPAEKLVRGEIIETVASEKTLLKIGDRYIAIDERTRLELTSLTKDEVVLTLYKGRILIASDIQAKTRIQTPRHSEATFLNGTASFVNYDFLETFSVLPFDATLSIIPNIGEGFLSSTPVDIHETEPFSVEDITFSISGSASEGFYAWASESLSPFLKSREQELMQ